MFRSTRSYSVMFAHVNLIVSKSKSMCCVCADKCFSWIRLHLLFWRRIVPAEITKFQSFVGRNHLKACSKPANMTSTYSFQDMSKNSPRISDVWLTIRYFPVPLIPASKVWFLADMDSCNTFSILWIGNDDATNYLHNLSCCTCPLPIQIHSVRCSACIRCQALALSKTFGTSFSLTWSGCKEQHATLHVLGLLPAQPSGWTYCASPRLAQQCCYSNPCLHSLCKTQEEKL